MGKCLSSCKGSVPISIYIHFEITDSSVYFVQNIINEIFKKFMKIHPSKIKTLNLIIYKCIDASRNWGISYLISTEELN